MQVEISKDGFIAMLIAQNGGAVVDELDRELMNGVAGIFDHKGKSSITLKVELSRVTNMETAVNVKHDIIAKHPQEERPTRAMFITAGNGLSDDFQKQQTLGLGEASTAVSGRLSDSSDGKVTHLNK